FQKPDGAKSRGSKSSDPELELAYALSRSLVEEERKKREIEEDKLASLGLNEILQEKRRKLALPQPPPLSSSNKGTRGLKGRRKGKVLTILMTRTQEVRERIITEKVAAILAGEFDTPIIPPENRSNVKQTSKFIYDDLYNKDLHLWKFACTGLEVPSTSYYVPDLADYIKPEETSFAEILKKNSKITGKLNYTALAEDSDMENDDESDVGAPVETTIVDAYCTQLALAELLCTQNIEDLTFSTDDDVTEVAKKKCENLQESTMHQIDTPMELSRNEASPPNNNNNNSNNNDNNNKVISSHDFSSVEKECEEKESNKKNMLQSHDERGENCKINNDANLICLSSDDDDATSSTVSFSPEKIQREKLEKAPVNSVTTESINLCEKITIEESSVSSKNIELDTPFYSKLIYDWSCLLASGENSDLVIVTEGSKIPVHSLVLFCRCSKILAEVIEEELYPTNEIFSPKKKWLNWCEFSFEAAYAFIVYLYTGVCPVKRKDKDDTWLGLYDLALKYSCSELIEHLESIYKIASDDDPVKENVENLEKCSVSESIDRFSKQISQTLVNNNCSHTESQRIPLSVNECNSPDIFDEWEADEQSTSLLNSINVTPPGASISDSILQGLKSPVLNLGNDSFDHPVNTPKGSSVNSNLSVKNTPVLNLDDKSPNCFANISNDSTVKSKEDDDNKCAQNKIIGTNKRNKEISKRNLSSEFKDLADGHTSGNHDSLGDMPESPLRMSSFSDLDYPSGNEIVDLTVSSDSEDEKGKKNSPCKQDCSKSLVKEFRKEGISLSAIELQDDNVGNSSNLSSLIDKSILNTPKNNSFDLPNIEIPSPKHSSDNVKVRTANHGISDDSLLNAVCDMEKGLQGVSERKIENNFKTPLQKFYKSKSYSEASPRTLATPNKGGSELLNSQFNITPMPDYKSMLSPDLKRELDKYGIRKLSRKKAITLLLHIYEETHPYVTDSEAEENFEDSFESSQKSLPPPSPIPDKPTGKTKGNALGGKKTNAKKSSDVDLNSSLSSNTSADTSFECLEETFLPCSQEEADDFSATQEGSQLVSLENRIKTFIRSDEELYSQILKYDPIWANELLRNLKLNGIKCSMAKLISFLDEQCITFRLPTKGRTRKRRRKNTSSPGKSPKKKRK
ncbi:Structure-specific endonuclease subunit SLX4, partial [Armadillidium nasatum]